MKTMLVSLALASLLLVGCGSTTSSQCGKANCTCEAGACKCCGNVKCGCDNCKCCGCCTK